MPRSSSQRMTRSEEAVTPAPPATPAAPVVFRVGVYMSRYSLWLRSLIRFDERPTYGAPGCVAWQPWDGVAIGPGLAQEMGLRAGDRVEVTLRRVEAPVLPPGESVMSDAV